jgi:LmbE family N-acetylglucosaminyl deacetylase
VSLAKYSSAMPEPIYALAFGAHPDDVEISCPATLLKLHREGKRVAVCDLTEGEMGTRGTRHVRRQEALEAARHLGYAERIISIWATPDSSTLAKSTKNHHRHSALSTYGGLCPATD